MIESNARPAETQPDVPSALVNFFHALRPQEGWLVLILALVAVLTLPSTAVTNGLILGLGPAIGLAVAGLLMGWWLGHKGVRGPLAIVLLAATGTLAVLWWGVHVFAIVPLFRQLGARATWWANPLRLPDQNLLQALLTQRADQAPRLTYFSDQWSSLNDFASRLGWWVDGVISGRGQADNLILVAIGCLIAWSVAAWAGWWIARHGRPFVALAPTGILLAQQVYAANDGHSALLTFLGAATALLVLGHLACQTRDWEKTATDYSPEIRLDSIAVAVVLTGLVVLISPTIPFITSGEMARQFWKIFESPYRDVEDRFGTSFRGAQPGRSLVPALGVAEGGMPRAHLLGGNPQLGKEVALRVQARGAEPGESLYWRGQTFALYTGRGWENPADALTETELAAGEPWSSTVLLADRRTVLTRMEVVAASRAVLYGAGEPISVDRPYRAVTRAPGELVALSAPRGPRVYNLLGGVIDPDPELLRLAGEDYPTNNGFRDFYLQLPSNLSPELLQYVDEIAADAETPYDRAIAIEAALREIPYSLDVPPPSDGVEVVSWFLFDLQRGYCDYYATSMVVMARLAGIPARLAIGYSTGDYDFDKGQYVVTELSAHSWPELYFPGFGWVPFEPTAGRAELSRVSAGGEIPPWMQIPGSMGVSSGLAALQQAAEEERRFSRVSGLTRWGLLALNVLAALWVLRARAWLRLASPPDSMDGLFERLTRYGSRLGSPMRESDTPREYLTSLTNAADEAADQATLFKDRAQEAASLVHTDAGRLMLAFEKSTYAPEETELIVSQYEQGRDWSPLWAALRRLSRTR